jgi:hypothetical protein
LHVRGKDGVGGRQHRAQEDGGPERQIEQQGADEGDECDRQQHRPRGENDREPPKRILTWHLQFEPGAEQGDDHRHFRDPLDDLGVVDGIDGDQPQGMRADQDAGTEIEHGGREGQARE